MGGSGKFSDEIWGVPMKSANRDESCTKWTAKILFPPRSPNVKKLHDATFLLSPWGGPAGYFKKLWKIEEFGPSSHRRYLMMKHWVLQKTTIDQRVSTNTGSPQTPPVSVLLSIASQWPEQELLFFFEGSAKRCFHTILELGNQGCLTVLARVQVGWPFFLKNPVPISIFILWDVSKDIIIDPLIHLLCYIIHAMSTG